MPATGDPRPPRPIEPGDIVATYCDELGEWAAAQIVHLDARRKEVDVLDLDWSGAEPADITALGELKPLRITHHGARWLAQMHREWVLPRSHKVIGRAPLLVTEPSSRFRNGWDTGTQLAYQRRWDAGDREDRHEHYLQMDSALIAAGNECETHPSSGQVRDLVVDVTELDCAALVGAFPNLTRLTLWGSLGWMTNAQELNRLHALRTISVSNVFGMSAADCLNPTRLTHVESIRLTSIPAQFAIAMRRTWAPEAVNGVYLDVTKPRQPQWVMDNFTNPLRDWDGRDGIPVTAYKKALTAWAKSTAPIRQALVESPPAVDLLARLEALGREFARAFDAVSGRSHLIETEERDELLEALHELITSAAAAPTVDREQAALAVIRGVNQERTW